jgi:hypothetical protein
MGIYGEGHIPVSTCFQIHDLVFPKSEGIAKKFTVKANYFPLLASSLLSFRLCDTKEIFR